MIVMRYFYKQSINIFCHSILKNKCRLLRFSFDHAWVEDITLYCATVSLHTVRDVVGDTGDNRSLRDSAAAYGRDVVETGM